MVSEEQNDALLFPITQEEVNDAMQQTLAGKAPSPNGFIVDFFHYYWHLIKADVWKIVEESLCETFYATCIQFHIPYPHP